MLSYIPEKERKRVQVFDDGLFLAIALDRVRRGLRNSGICNPRNEPNCTLWHGSSLPRHCSGDPVEALQAAGFAPEGWESQALQCPSAQNWDHHHCPHPTKYLTSVAPLFAKAHAVTL